MPGSLEPGAYDKRPAASMDAAGRLLVAQLVSPRYGVPPFKARYCVSAAFTF